MTDNFLNSFYTTTSGETWVDSTNWLSAKTSNEWYGVNVDNNASKSIVKLTLSNNNLKGLLKDPFSTLSTIIYIDLSRNNLSGSILNIFNELVCLKELRVNNNKFDGALPQLKNCKNLEILHLYENQFTGEIPSNYGDLIHFKEFLLHQNRLEGPLPDSLRNLVKLEIFNVANNSLKECLLVNGIKGVNGNLSPKDDKKSTFVLESDDSVLNLTSEIEVNKRRRSVKTEDDMRTTTNTTTTTTMNGNHKTPGSIQTLFEHMSSMKQLILSYNSFSGPLPLIQHMKTLEVLCADHNDFIGAIPDEYGEVSSLKELILTSNNLQGSIPDSLKQLINLKKLHVNDNKLTGLVPYWLGDLSQLEEVNLGRNNFIEGNLETLSRLQYLTKIGLSALNISGIIPEYIWGFTNIRALYMADNNLTGVFPDMIGDLVHLEKLYMNGNQFTGNYPSCLFRLVHLKRLRLNDNNLSGSLPKNIGDMKQFEELNLSNNKFRGDIPLSICKLSNLQILCLNDNKLSGIIPGKIGELSDLEEIDLSNNQLTGEIPHSICRLGKLKQLYVNDNKLSGGIPETIGDILTLEELALQQNTLTGEIPISICMLVNLKELYLNNNKLTGGIPSDLSTLKHLTDFIVNNNQLSGDIPDVWNSLTELSTVKLNHNNLSGYIPESLLDLPLECLDLCGNEFGRDFDEDISTLKWEEQKFWWNIQPHNLQEAMIKACKQGYMRIIKYLIKSKEFSNFLYKDDLGKHALDYLVQSDPTGAVELFATLEIQQSDQNMYKKLKRGSYLGEIYVDKVFTYDLKDGDYCIRGSNEKVIKKYWFQKVGKFSDVKRSLVNIIAKYQNKVNTKILPSIKDESDAAVMSMNTKKKNDKENIDIIMTLNCLFSDSAYPVTSYTLPFEHMSSVEFLNVFIAIYDETGDVSVFENENVKVAILAAWERYGRTYHVCFLLFYMGFLGLLAYSHFVYQFGTSRRVTVGVIILNAMLSLYEVAQMTKFGMFSYISDYENIMEVCGSILAFIGCGIRLRYGEEADSSRGVMAIASILLWTNALDYLRPFTLTGSLVRLVFATVKPIIPFCLILALVLFGFSQAFYLLTYDDANFTEFTAPDTAYLYSFAYMMGQSAYHLNGNVKSNMMTTLTVLFIAFVQILLLNLLIAFLNNIYTDIQAHPEAQMLSERCQIIVSQVRLRNPRGKRFIHYIKKNSDVEKDDETMEEKKNTNTEILHYIDKHQEIIATNQSDMKADMAILKNDMISIRTQLVMKSDISHLNHKFDNLEEKIIEQDPLVLRDKINTLEIQLNDTNKKLDQLMTLLSTNKSITPIKTGTTATTTASTTTATTTDTTTTASTTNSNISASSSMNNRDNIDDNVLH